MLRFFAVPAWQVRPIGTRDGLGSIEPLHPTAALDPASLGAALAGVEYRGESAWERAVAVAAQGTGPQVYAKPPHDLPALLRTADQILLFMRRRGERAFGWNCTCGTRHSSALGRYRPAAIRCTRCGRVVELESWLLPDRGAADQEPSAVNASRQALADFFREAMARGWPVLVERS